MVHELLSRIAEHKLDARACELRDHLIDLKVVRAEAARLGIASASVLENTKEAERRIEKHRRDAPSAPPNQIRSEWHSCAGARMICEWPVASSNPPKDFGERY